MIRVPQIKQHIRSLPLSRSLPPARPPFFQYFHVAPQVQRAQVIIPHCRRQAAVITDACKHLSYIRFLFCLPIPTPIPVPHSTHFVCLISVRTCAGTVFSACRVISRVRVFLIDLNRCALSCFLQLLSLVIAPEINLCCRGAYRGEGHFSLSRRISHFT